MHLRQIIEEKMNDKIIKLIDEEHDILKLVDDSFKTFSLADCLFLIPRSWLQVASLIIENIFKHALSVDPTSKDIDEIAGNSITDSETETREPEDLDIEQIHKSLT